MIPLFTLPLDQLRAEHVETLRREAVPESQTVEFKQTLAARSGRTAPWLDGGDEVGDHGRNDVLKEVVAFANSGGGNVVLGIVESGDHPRRAAGVNHVPRCHELADRFRLMARDCIDPQLPSLEVCGVPMKGRDEYAGIVLFRVPPSRLAPHRLKPTKHCYLRRADRTEEMTMREIQDMSVRLARGGEAIRERLEERRTRYLVPTKSDWDGLVEVGVRVSVLPVGLGGSIFIEKVYARNELTVLRTPISASADGRSSNIYLPASDLESKGFRPILRGAQRIDSDEHRVEVQSVYSDGLVEFVHKHTDPKYPIKIDWVLGMAANALLVANTARQLAGVPGAELLLDVELRADAWSARQPHGHSFRLSIETAYEQPRDFGGEPLRPPTQSIGGQEEFGSALHRLLNDMRNAVGWRDVEQFDLDLRSGA